MKTKPRPSPKNISQRAKHVASATLPTTQVVLGPKLGEGEYSSVYEVESFSLLRPEDIAVVGDVDGASSHPPRPSDDEMGQRLQMKRMETYRTTGKARYALKHINDHKDDTNKYVQAAG